MTVVSPLPLSDAVSRALCANPKTRGAWATIQLETAAVRTAKESYLPNLSAKATETESATQTTLTYAPELNTFARSLWPAGAVSFSWLLLDFGQRGNALESARQLLAAARANMDLNLQQVFLQTGADYYDAQAAQASLESTQEIETLTRSSADAAQVRVNKGVSPVSDELQAQTAYQQARVNHVKAESEFNTKRGALAIDMGLDPDRPINLPPAESDVLMRPEFEQSLRDLIEEAKRTHPSVEAAARQLASAEADERAARAHGYPSISLVAGLSRSKEPLTPSLGSPSVPGSVTERSIGVEFDLPISDLLWKRGLIARAHAQVLVQREALNATEQQIAQEVWNSYTALQADTQNLANSEALLQSARESFDVSQRRYTGGVGTILELLSAQSAYASAQQQRIRAMSDWRIARLALGASLGQLTLSSVH